MTRTDPFRAALLALLVGGSPSLPGQAQALTHLNVPAKQMVYLSFRHASWEPAGYYTALTTIAPDGSYGMGFSIPPGMNLVITDFSVSGDAPGGYSGDTGGRVYFGWFDPALNTFTSHLWSDALRLEATGGTRPFSMTRHFSSGFRFPAGTTRRPGFLVSAPWWPSGTSNATVMALGYLVADN
ncbi:MAG: hypothetical protein HY823_06220 [Acidobacteria bacterium]|nr:hypothetical protein [Acidobacteriota bacterium]